MVIHVENESFDELGQEISLVKGGPGKRSGGTPSGQSGGCRGPRGECFAPSSIPSERASKTMRIHVEIDSI